MKILRHNLFPRTPEYNDVVDRMNINIQDRMKVMLSISDVANSF